MEYLLKIFFENPLGQTTGIIALLINIFCLIFFKNNKFIYGITVVSVFWGIHFYFMGLIGGFIVNIIDIFKNYFSIKYKKNKNVVYLFLFIYFLFGFYLYENIYSILPIIASFVGIYSFFYLQDWKLKLGYTIVVLIWLIYGVIGKSIGGVIADFSLIISGIIGIYLELKNKNYAKPTKKL